MELDLSGKTALVCGSTQGIGKAAAHELALLGAKVCLLARNEEKLKVVCASLPKAHGQKHFYAVADFSNNKSVLEAAQRIANNSNTPIHILINNTGGPPPGLAHLAGLDEYLTAFQNHLVNNQILVQAFIEGMKAASYGRIINVISTSVKAPLKGLGVSNTIRGAVANWSKTLSMELAEYGITVNNVLPGATETERLEQIFQNKSMKMGVSAEEVKMEMLAEIPANRFAKPSEIGQAIAFLASPAASYINGINLPVDGGRTPTL
jgi:3-oxoacyl-[acyl-carrier protein] reductase